MVASEQTVWHAERACALAWPARAEQQVAGWVVRRSGGGTRRINSASASPDARLDPDVLARIEALYAAQDRPTIFRITSMLPRLDAALTEAGYQPAKAVTHTLAADLNHARNRDTAVTLSRHADRSWIEARMRLSLLFGAGERDHVAALERLSVPAVFARLVDDDVTQALGYVALIDELAVVEAVATDPACQRRGFARRCVSTLLAAAHDAGARTAVLQVAADNAPALALYAQQGFTIHLYDYHYRRRAR